MNLLEQIRELVATTEEDYEKFYEKGNAAAGTRVRKNMQELKTLAQELRLDVQKTKNSDKQFEVYQTIYEYEYLGG